MKIIILLSTVTIISVQKLNLSKDIDWFIVLSSVCILRINRHNHSAILLVVFYSLSVIQAQDVHSLCGNLAPSPTLTPFVERLPIPKVINVSTGAHLTLGAYTICQSVHPDLPDTTFYGFGTSKDAATYPGPTLEAERNVTSYIRIENNITDPEHMFVVDRTLHRADPPKGGVPIITHLHGSATESKHDGHPEAWCTAFGDKGPTFVTIDNVYPNRQPASLLWYHNHTLGWTRLNVAAGLLGLYMIRGGDEPKFLPEGKFEIPLVIQDKQFFPNGSINFPDIGFDPAAHPQWCPDYFGDTILVNGKAWPYLNVVRKIYRFRILNGANARVFTLSFSDSRVEFLQIGTDGGYLWNPMLLRNLTIAPAYRVDVLVDFSKVPVGTVLYLNNSAPAPFPDGDPINSPPSTTYVMKFNVASRVQGVPRSQNVVVPTSIGTAPDVDSLMRNATFRNVTLEFTPPPNLTFLLGGRHWMEPVTETPQLYTTEIWDIIHLIPGGSQHPIHLHLVNFLAVHQQAFNVTRLTAGECTLEQPYPEPASCFTEHPQPPDATRTGWKDTVIIYPFTVLRLVVPFSPNGGGTYLFDPTSFPGYIWHCHNLDHEDNEMMRPLQFLPPP